MKEKIMSFFCAIAAMFNSLVGGTAASSDAATAQSYASQTLVGQVLSADEGSVTLQLQGENDSQPPQGGEQPGRPADGQQPPEQPSGDNTESSDQPPEMPSGDNQPDGTQPPEKPADDSQADGGQPASGDNAQNGSQQPPQMPGGGQSADQQPPEKPDGDGQVVDGEQPPEKPDDTAQSGGKSENAPEPPQGGQGMTGETVTFTVTETARASLQEISANDVVQVETDENGEITSIEKLTGQVGAGPAGGQGGGFGGSGQVTQGTAATTLDTDGTYSGEIYTSTGDDENALRVDGAAVTLENITVDKSAGASSNTEDGDFYGMNAALLATNGAQVTIKNAVVTSSAQNGNGVFSYGSGTVVNISDSSITTSADNSGGIQTTGGATTNASDLTVETSGNSSAAIRSDRGGGTVNVNGGSYTSNGYNSPAVYSTADITVKNAQLTANNSEALVIEGQNSITLENCEVSGNMSDTKGTSSSENVHNVMIYQSMSGDAEVGTSSFSMTGGTLTSDNGDLFYITNTHCVLTLSGVDIQNHETDGYLMLVTGNSASRGWGTAGANGAQVEFTADGQTLEGDIAVDSISTLNMTLSGGSTFTGTLNIIENAQGGTAVENNACVTVESGSTWNLTGNCTLTSLTNNGTINFNGYTITLADGTVLNG